jgi:dolichol-phosphate mannosyltransferase
LDWQGKLIMKTIVVVPTFNEATNIQPLVEQLLSTGSDLSICFIDDQSPDGTGQVADELSRSKPQVHVIHRTQKDGRGSATLEGFKYALKQNADYVLEMDADFSHDPADLPRFLEKIKEADVVIGSRYLPESRIENWPLSRRIFSRLANFFAWSLLRIPITDYTNGFRCYRRKTIESLEFGKIKAKGFIVLSDIAYQLHLQGYRFQDIPVRFINRKRGISNFSLNEIIQAWTEVCKLKWSYKRPPHNAYDASR